MKAALAAAFVVGLLLLLLNPPSLSGAEGMAVMVGGAGPRLLWEGRGAAAPARPGRQGRRGVGGGPAPPPGRPGPPGAGAPGSRGRGGAGGTLEEPGPAHGPSATHPPPPQ